MDIERTWDRAIKNLKSLILVNRQDILFKLKERHDQEWTNIAKSYNNFDDSHVTAYRRGVRAAIDIVNNHGIETFDYIPKVGDVVSIRGVGGKVTKVADGIVVVSGTYTYVSIDGTKTDDDNWSISYKLEDVLEADVRIYWPIERAIEITDVLSWDYTNVKGM